MWARSSLPQENPFPKRPTLQAHINDPFVLVQVAFVLQLAAIGPTVILQSERIFVRVCRVSKIMYTP